MTVPAFGASLRVLQAKTPRAPVIGRHELDALLTPSPLACGMEGCRALFPMRFICALFLALVCGVIVAQEPPSPKAKSLLEIDLAERARREAIRTEMVKALAKHRALLKRLETNSRIAPDEALTIPDDEVKPIVFRSIAQKDKYIALGRDAIRAVERHIADLDRTTKRPRQPHPELPEAAVLTDAEKAHVAQVIKDAILDDLGKLPKGKDPAEVRRALAALPPDALPQVLEAFNYVANQGWTCPTNVLAGPARFGNLTWNANVRDLDRIIFVNKYIGVGVTNPNPPQTYKDVKIIAEMALKTALAEIAAEMKLFTLQQMIDRVGKVKGFEWRYTMGAIARKREDRAAGAYLLKSLRESSDKEQTKTILEALADWAGIDRDSEHRQSLGAIVETAQKKVSKLEGEK